MKKQTKRPSRRKTSSKVSKAGLVLLTVLVLLLAALYLMGAIPEFRQAENPTEQISAQLRKANRRIKKAFDSANREIFGEQQSKNTSSRRSESRKKGSSAGRQSSDASRQESASSEKIFALEIPILKSNAPEQLIPHLGYTVSFNSDTRLPNWVAYELTRAETCGDLPRESHFECDPDVEGAQAEDDDYRNSGWDRGHMAPAADMKWSRQAMKESFYFTNVCPQNRNLNRGDWKALEESCRDWAKQYDGIYIACGPIISRSMPPRLGVNRVVIPDSFFKVILVRHDGKYEGMGFVFENKAGHKSLASYACTIDHVEELTSTDFFPQLPDEIEAEVEARKKTSFWGL